MQNCSKNLGSGTSSIHSRRQFSSRPDAPRHLGFKLLPCKYCGRTFFVSRLEYHEDVCRAKLRAPIRPLYDSAKVRITGTVAEHFQPKVPKTEPNPALNPQWRENHIPFQTMRSYFNSSGFSSREEVSGATLGNLGALKEYVQCPICGRRFNPDAANFHIPQCMDHIFLTKSKVKPGAFRGLKHNQKINK